MKTLKEAPLQHGTAVRTRPAIVADGTTAKVVRARVIASVLIGSNWSLFLDSGDTIDAGLVEPDPDALQVGDPVRRKQQYAVLGAITAIEYRSMPELGREPAYIDWVAAVEAGHGVRLSELELDDDRTAKDFRVMVVWENGKSVIGDERFASPYAAEQQALLVTRMLRAQRAEKTNPFRKIAIVDEDDNVVDEWPGGYDMPTYRLQWREQHTVELELPETVFATWLGCHPLTIRAADRDKSLDEILPIDVYDRLAELADSDEATVGVERDGVTLERIADGRQ